MRRIAGSVVRILAALAIILIIAGAGLAWRLAVGPVSIAFLTPYLEEALNQGRGGEVGIRFGDTMLAWAGWDRTLDIRARDVVIVDAEQTAIAELPEISIGLSGRALLEARLRLSSVDVIGAETVVIRRSDGSIGLGFGEASIRGGDNPLLVRLANELLVPPDAAPNTGNLTRVSILDSNLTLIDQINGALWRAAKVDLVVLRRGQSITGDARLEFDFGGRRARAAGTVSYDSVSGSAKVGVSFQDLYLPDLARQGRVLDKLAGLELQIGGNVQFAVGTDGKVSDGRFSVSSDSGFIDLPDSFAERLPVVRATAHGSFKWSAVEAVIDELAVDLGGTLVTGQGVVRLVADEPEFAGEVRVLDLPIRRLPALWPHGIGGAARDWVASRIGDGRIVEANIELAGLRQGEDSRSRIFAADFVFSGLSVAYLEGLPPLVSVSGRGRIADNFLEVSVDTADLDGIDVSEMTLAMAGLSAPAQEMSIAFVVRGQLAKVLDILDAPELGFVRGQGIPARSIDGAVAARTQITLRRAEQGTSFKPVDFAAAANLADVSGSLPFPAVDFDRGTLSLRLDRNGFDLDGAVSVGGTPVTVRWRQNLGDRGTTGRYLLRTQIDEAGRERLGLGTAGAIGGFVDVSVDAAVDRGSLKRAVIEANFLGAAIDLAALRWRKSPHRPARARAVVIPQSDGSVIVDAIEFRADDLVASGVLELAADAAIRRFDLSHLIVGRSDLSFSLRPRAPEGFIVAVEGQRLDFNPYIGDLLEGGEGTLPPLDFSLRVDELLIGEGESLRGARGRGRYDGDRWVELSVSGGFGTEGKTLAFRIEAENGIRRVRLDSADAGLVAQAIGFTDNARGGRLELAALIDDTMPGEPIKGRVQIREFTLVKAPALAQILTLASLQGILELLRGGNGISFVSLDLPFELKDGVLKIDEGRAFGPVLGATASGTYALTTEDADFNGTIVPAYTLNSLLGNIPLLGDLLVGGKGEGVFALTYSFRGKADEADIQVNPLSALAPGFLRRFVTLLERRPANGAKDDQDGDAVEAPNTER